MRILIVIILLQLNFTYLFGQSKSEVSELLTKLSLIENSKDITKHHKAKKFIELGEKALQALASFFIDTTKTNTYSECRERFLTKGEIAIILADKIEIMPYASLTGIQNCLLEFCEDNPNLIEFYFGWQRPSEQELRNFQKKYKEWLISVERESFPPRVNNSLRNSSK